MLESSDVVHLESDFLLVISVLIISVLLIIDRVVTTPAPLTQDQVETCSDDATHMTHDHRDPEPVVAGTPHLATPAKHPGHETRSQVSSRVDGVTANIIGNENIFC